MSTLFDHRVLSRSLVVAVLAAVGLLGSTGFAQRLDLDAPEQPEPTNGGVLADVEARLKTEAEEFRLEYRALAEDAPRLEHLAMRARIALTELLADWLADDGADSDDAATRRVAALAFASMLPRFDDRCRAMVRGDDPSEPLAERLALEALVCLCDPDCRPMLRATGRDDRADDPLVRAVAGALDDLLVAERFTDGFALSHPIAEIADRHQWPDGVGASWDSIVDGWSEQAGRDRVIRDWIVPHFAALSSVLESMSADTTARDATIIDEARDLLSSLGAEVPARPSRTLAGVLRDAVMTDRTLRAIEVLGAVRPGPRNGVQHGREALRAARHAAYRLWLDGALPSGHVRVVVALERVAEARSEASRERPRSTEPPGPLATERRLCTALDSIESEIVQSLPGIIGERSRLSHPETVSLLARHQSAASMLSHFLDLPARRAALSIEQGTGVDAPLIGRVNQKLSQWQREAASTDALVSGRAHRGIAAYARLHAAYMGLRSSSLADLARAIERPGLARVDWREAVFIQRRDALVALAASTGSEAELASVNEISERLETFARLAAAAGPRHAGLARPLHRHFGSTIESALTQLRDNGFGRSVDPMGSVREAAGALHTLHQLLEADPVSAAALGAVLQAEPIDTALPMLRHAGRPWTPTGPSRSAGAHAVRWLGELHHAWSHDAPAEDRQRIADHAIQHLHRYREARERGQ